MQALDGIFDIKTAGVLLIVDQEFISERRRVVSRCSVLSWLSWLPRLLLTDGGK